MATTVEPIQAAPAPEVQRIVLPGVSWNEYEQILEALGERPGLRSTYDRGALELMSTSQIHEIWKSLLGQMIELLCWELDISKRSGGSFTYRREDVKRGLEPDECYWVQHEPATRGKVELDFAVDPPPDLAVEIEYTRSSLDRHGIYAALGVPELWTFDGKTLRVLLLQEDGTYQEQKQSAAFPFLPITGLPQFLKLDDERDEQARLKAFIEWVREQVPDRQSG